MNKPLTIEQLKALPVGEWVWVIDKCIYGNGIYCTIDCQDEDEPICILSSRINTQVYKFDDYGKTWTAYKNKEQADGKYDNLAVELEAIKQDKANLERTIEEISTALYGANIIIDADGDIHDKRVEEAKKQTAKDFAEMIKDKLIDYCIDNKNVESHLYDIVQIIKNCKKEVCGE